MSAEASTLLAGVMGWPVSHSLSPRLHGFWLKAYGIDGAYVPLAVKPENIERALRALPLLGFRGVNLTLPHKETALRALDRVEPLARRIGAVNTVTVGADGGLEGRNTDAFGFIENLRQGAAGWHANAGPAVVLGAGGAARAVVVALHDAGAPLIRVVNRSRFRAEAMAAEIDGVASRLEIKAWETRAEALADAALLVNATSLGLAGGPDLDIALDVLPRQALVTDLVYRPLETALLKAAKARGNRTVDGLGMLLHQARPGFAAWFGHEPEVTPALRAAVLA
jgi:shikimate dehydrogenase